jgi:hypothetical protein
VENNSVLVQAHLVWVVVLEAVYLSLSFDHLVPFFYLQSCLKIVFRFPFLPDVMCILHDYIT